MARYESISTTGGSVAIVVCPRCSFKYKYSELRQDPNTKQWVCKDCCDLYDPWRMAARIPENISLDHPRPDSSVSTVGTEDYTLGNEMNFAIEFVDGVTIGTNP